MANEISEEVRQERERCRRIVGKAMEHLSPQEIARAQRAIEFGVDADSFTCPGNGSGHL